MLLMGCFATCAGSTGGGIKMVRLLLMLKQARRELVRILHPNVVNPVVLGGQAISDRVMQSVTAFTAVIACVNNIGPGLGQVGPAGNYQGLSDFQTWVCTFAMLLGRLELLSVLVLFTPAFWRR